MSRCALVGMLVTMLVAFAGRPAAVAMAYWTDVNVLICGVVTAVCFFVPGLKYHRQRLRAARTV